MSLANKLAQERRSRLAAERLLELKQAELFAANQKLGQHARKLSNEIVETRAEVKTVRDENIRVKSDLSAAHKQIERVERRLWQSIETINDGFAFYSPELELIMANESYLAVFDGLEEVKPGVSYVTVLQLLTDEGIVNTGDLDAVAWRQMMIERIQSPNPEPIVIMLWSGHYIRVMDRRGPDGDIISLGINITASVRYEESLKAARESAETANRAKSAFLANMSHEIRTPMNGVVGMADVLTGTPLTEEQRLYVDTIKTSGEALLVIINDVLDYSKIEAEKLQLHAKPFDLEQSIHDVLTLLQSSAQDKGILLAIDYEMFLTPDFIGDPGRIRQILTNLVGNAVKFTQEGSVIVRVSGRPVEKTKNVMLTVTVEDTGIGIPDDMIEHVFGEFNQVDSERNRQFDGTGLGLSITTRLIKLMGGRIWLESKVGEGSCFGFDIELETPESTTLPHPDICPDLRHVLVADDNATNRALIGQQLEKIGLKVTACQDEKAVLDEMNDTVDVVVLAPTSAEAIGPDLVEAMRTTGHQQDIILLTPNQSFAKKHPAHEDIKVIGQRRFRRKDLFRWLCEVKPVAIPAPDGDLDHTEASALTSGPAFAHRSTEQASDAPPVDAPPAPPRRMRVLAAEDNKTNRLVFGKMLKALDIDLKFACNGLEAVEAHQDFKPDVIFMDISMPLMDGKEATGEIRKKEEKTGSHVPIIAMTAHAMTGDGDEILKAGLDHYMTKPLRKQEIVEQIVNNCPEDALPPCPEVPDQAAAG